MGNAQFCIRCPVLYSETLLEDREVLHFNLIVYLYCIGTYEKRF